VSTTVDFSAILTEIDTLSTPKSEKISDLPTETLLSRHEELVAERDAMPDSTPREQKAGVTNRVKHIESVLRDRNVEFTPMPLANKPQAIDTLSDDALVVEAQSLIERRNDTNSTSGQKSAAVRRLKLIKTEVEGRMTAQAKSTRTSRKAA
jgi:hypothetical protein